MKTQKERAARLRRFVVMAATASLTVGVTGSVGCLSRPVEPVEPRTTSTVIERLTQSSVDKIDLVLGIDNSRSMADKQQILADAVPDLVDGLLNPRCIDSNGVPAQQQPAGPLEDCAPGTKREFNPVFNIHIGVTTSSIGGHGGDACTVVPGKPETNSNNDSGHLIARLDSAGGADVPTYQEKKFLAWDPKQQLQPPGEGDKANLIQNLRSIVTGTGQTGCGYEAQLESVYRFLVDPSPYETITVGADGKIVTDGIDATIIQQRADFMRPDSLLAVIMLTDENDCSIKESNQYYLAAQLNTSGGAYHLPKARATCTTDPLSACCRSCGQPAGTDENGNACPDDPACGTHDDVSDAANLRCWDQKRRFGIDFLYPTARYVEAFASTTIQNRNGQIVPNPIFTDLDPTDTITNIRDTGLVFLAGIVGVPWQDIARNPNDLTQGFKNYDELSAPNDQGVTGWDVILGDPEAYIAPLDPHMNEAVDPRSGTNPITGTAIAPPNSPNGTNALNGHEYTIDARDDLQYACVFDLPTSRNCGTGSTEVSCDCQDPNNDNPLCEPNPNDLDANGNPRRTLQTRAKAYPGLRELAVLKGMASQGIVGSVCPKQVSDPNSPDYGYRPAIGSIIDRLKQALGGQCLPRTLTPDEKGQVPCLILEARKTDTCDCNTKARTPVSTDHEQAQAAAEADPFAATSGWNCFCEITQLTGDELTACQEDINDPPVLNGAQVDGWCYIDATTSPPTGNAALVENCPESEKRIVRFVGQGAAQPGATLFITCSGD